MPVTLSIKNAPDDVVARLRERAAANHRSLQGELMSILEAASHDSGQPRFLTIAQAAALSEQVGLYSPSSVDMIREDRDR